METLLNDIRYGFRMLRKTPGFTAVALITLMLGIGANVAIFTIVYGVLLRPLPYANPGRLVQVYDANPERATTFGPFSPQDYDDLVRQNEAFESLAAYWYAPGLSGKLLAGDGEPMRLETAYVTFPFFSTLGISPARGRTFVEEENVAGKDRSIVLSDSLWRRRFGADPAIVGRAIPIDGTKFTVVGIMPSSFQFPAPRVDAWVPISLLGDDDIPHRRGIRWMSVVARLKAGQTIASAQAATGLILQRLERAYPDSNAGWGHAVVQGLHEATVGQVRPAIVVLWTGVMLVLLIACANVANLLLARGTGRARELAIRTALGAARRRVVMQLIREGVLLSLLGGAASFLLMSWVVLAMVRLGAGSIPRPSDVRLDTTVVLFALLVSGLSGVIFSVVPALRLTRQDIYSALKESGPTSTASGRHQGVRGLLVVGEIALACMLLVASGLVLKSFWRLINTDPGFEMRNVLVVPLEIPMHKYQGRMAAYRDTLLRRIAELPGVVAVGASKTMPLQGGGEPYRFTIEGRQGGPVEVFPRAGVYIVSQGYFRALGIPIVSGRVFDERDFAENHKVAVINRALARQYWPGEDPVGKYLSAGKGRLEIIGVVGDVRNEGLADDPAAAIYGPMSLFPRIALNLFIRTSTDPMAISGAVRHAIRAVEPEQPVEQMAPLAQVVRGTVSQPRFLSVLLGLFGGVALVLAAVGVFGVISYSVQERTHEIGVRMALGARPGDVLRLVLSGSACLTGIGVALGLLGALLSSHLLTKLLYGIGPRDPATLVAVTVLLGGVALLAAYLPARRAARVDPMVALRHE